MSTRVETWCPDCGRGVKIDEDGLCVSCGSSAYGNGSRAACALATAALAVLRHFAAPVDPDYEHAHLERALSAQPHLAALRAALEAAEVQVDG